MLQAIIQFVRDNPYYVLWVIGTGALCMALASLHDGEQDYLSHDNDDLDTW